MLEVGARVRTRAQHTGGHTRLPAYLQNRPGRVIRILGCFRFADDAAQQGTAARAEPLYTVQFTYGDHTVCADLFEPYLEIDR